MSAKIDWEKVAGSVATGAIDSSLRNPHARRILSALALAGDGGLSFKELRKTLKLSASSLANALGDLADGAVVENRLERRKGSKDFSYYRVTELGELVSSEIETLFAVTRRRIIEHAQLPELAQLQFTSPTVGPVDPWQTPLSRLMAGRSTELRRFALIERRPICHAIEHPPEQRWFRYGSRFVHQDRREPPRLSLNAEELLQA